MTQVEYGIRAPRSRLAIVMRVLLIVYWCGIFYLTHLPGPKLPQVPLSDKLEHYIAFGALGGLLFLAFWTSKPRRNDLAFLILAIGIGYGALDEWTQALPFVRRDCNFLDWCADCAGMSTAVVSMSIIHRISQRWWKSQ